MSAIRRENLRQRRTMEGSEEAAAIISKILVAQMGSSKNILSQGEIDQRKFAVLTEEEQVALGHFAYRAVTDKNRYFGHLVDWILNTSPSLQGLGRRQTISLTAAAAGGSPQEKVKKPNVLARSIWNRRWREKALAEGKEPEE